MPAQNNIRIALAQFCPVNATPGPHKAGTRWFETLEQNLLKAREWVERAAADKADVVVFPEYFLQGLVDEERQYLTYPSQCLTEYLSRLAQEWSVSIVGTIVHAQFPSSNPPPSSSPFADLPVRGETTSGPVDTPEWDAFCEANPAEAHDPPLANTAFFIEGGSGKLVDEYIKRNLWHPEREYLTRGEDDHQVFETKWGRCGFVICWDAGHPGAAQALSDLKVDIVFAPTYWLGYDSSPVIEHHHDHPPSYENEILTALSCARAFETEAVWIMVNAGGPAEEKFIGGSGVWMPLKGRLAGMDEKEGMKVVDVDLNVLKDARQLYKIRTDTESRRSQQ